MSNPPTPAPGWWTSFLQNCIIRPWLWFKRKMRAARQWIWRMLKAPFRLLSRNRKQTRELSEGVTDAVTDSIPDGDTRISLDKPGRHSRDSIIADLPSGGTGGGTGYGGGTSNWSPGGSSMLDGCGDGCGDGCSGCDLGCDMMLFAMFFLVPYYHIKGHPWHERHLHRKGRAKAS